MASLLEKVQPRLDLLAGDHFKVLHRLVANMCLVRERCNTVKFSEVTFHATLNTFMFTCMLLLYVLLYLRVNELK